MTERGEAKRDNAIQHKNSGRGNYQKGDASWRNFVVDYKEYEKSISITQSMWSKICTDTFKVGRDKSPVLKLIIGGASSKTRLAVIEWALLEQLVDAWENKENKNG